MSPTEFSQLQQLITDNHTEIVQRLAVVETKLEDLPDRVRALEQTKWTLEGARMALAAGVSFAVGYLKSLR